MNQFNSRRPVARALVAVAGLSITCSLARASVPASAWPLVRTATESRVPPPAPPAPGDRLEALIHQADLLAVMGVMPALCFVSDPTPEQLKIILGKFHALPPTLQFEPRFFTSSTVWSGANSTLGASGRAVPAQLTYSFVPDGTSLFNCNTGGSAPSDLNASFVSAFGANNEDQGRELLRQAWTGWHKWTAMSYAEVGDDGVAVDNTTFNSAFHGTTRIGGVPEGNTGILACNFFPSSGADMSINSTYFSGSPGYFVNNPQNNYRYFRNVVGHEHGHGLAAIHPVPCDHTKLMEPFINTNFELQQIDDIRFGQRNYGDRFAGNNSAAAATNFGDLTSPTLHSVIERNLSTNGVSGFNSSNQDWFKFTLSSPQTVTITVQPVGGSYLNGAQSSSCNTSLQTTVNSGVAGNPDLDLRDSTGVNVLQSSSNAAGVADTVTASLSAGTYYIRVIDNGPNFTGNGNNGDQIIQLYDLTVRVGTSKAPPKAYAGLNKRCQMGKPCYFMGDINSYATETGAAINAYVWDLDGDGLPDSAVAQPVFTYNTAGVYNVTLTVGDDTGSGLTGSDTIQVTVFNNDECGGAFAWVSNVGNQPFSNIGATNSAAPDPTGVGSCSGPIANDVWYTWTAPQGGVLTLQTSAVFGARLAVYSSTDCPATAGALIACTQANQPVSATLTGGQRILVQVGSMLQDQTGSGTVNLSFMPATGACCPGDGGPCQITSVLACTAYYLGDNAPCQPNPCPAPGMGACCLPDGSCVFMTDDDCSNLNYSYYGDEVPCLPDICPQPPTGACCTSDGTCQSLSTFACSAAGGVYQGDDHACLPNPCPQPSACCFADGTCLSKTSADCGSAGGVFQGPGQVCSPNPCPRACCFAGDGSCQVLTPANCSGSGGSSQQAPAVCSPNSCPQPGACCFKAGCSVTLASQCTGANTHWAGASTVCNAAGNNTAPCCRADFNQSGGITIQDIFDYLPRFFAHAIDADFNRDTMVSPQDLFDYLVAWFSRGCP